MSGPNQGPLDAARISGKHPFSHPDRQVAFIHALTEMSEEHSHYADVSLSKGKCVSVTLSTEVDARSGLSEKDFLLADCFDQIPVGNASASQIST